MSYATSTSRALHIAYNSNKNRKKSNNLIQIQKSSINKRAPTKLEANTRLVPRDLLSSRKPENIHTICKSQRTDAALDGIKYTSEKPESLNTATEPTVMATLVAVGNGSIKHMAICTTTLNERSGWQLAQSRAAHSRVIVSSGMNTDTSNGIHKQCKQKGSSTRSRTSWAHHKIVVGASDRYEVSNEFALAYCFGNRLFMDS